MNRAVNTHTSDSLSSARLAGVLDTAVDGIIVTDVDGQILLFNRACERIFGHSTEFALGRNICSLMASDEASIYGDYLASYRRSGNRKLIGIGREIMAQHSSGVDFPIELSVGETLTPEGPQLIGIVRDLRARKETDQRLNQLQSDLMHIARVSAIDEMGAALAHELNQPLTAITLYLQTILRGAQRARTDGHLHPEVTLILAKAAHEAERAGKIIHRMRSFAEKREPKRTRQSLAALIDDSLELTLLGHYNNLRVNRRDEANLPHVLVDGVQIQQIIVNLIRNAIEAVKGRAGAEIWVSTRLAQESVIFEISDSGPGIAVDMQKNMFKAFSTTKKSGLGIGLAISKSIAQNHGGDLTCEPGGGGRGATFVLHLPYERSESAVSPAMTPINLLSEDNRG